MKPQNFQQIIATLKTFWAEYGCLILPDFRKKSEKSWSGWRGSIDKAGEEGGRKWSLVCSA